MNFEEECLGIVLFHFCWSGNALL